MKKYKGKVVAIVSTVGAVSGLSAQTYDATAAVTAGGGAAAAAFDLFAPLAVAGFVLAVVLKYARKGAK